MLARHPVSGKSIRILRSDATLAKDGTTLVWIQPTFHPSHRWSRWSTVLTDYAALPVLQDAVPTCILLTTLSDVIQWLPWLQSHPTAETILLISNNVELYLQEKHINYSFLRIEELNTTYPFINGLITLSSPIDHLVSAIAQILRIRQLVWSSSTVNSILETWQRTCSGIIKLVSNDATDSVIPSTWWISQYYEPSQSRRARELRECLERNSKCPYIDNILLLTEEDGLMIPSSEKIKVVSFKKRATYADTFQLAMDHIPKGNGSILLFSNSDIWFDATLKHLWSINFSNTLCLALLRWEEAGIYGPRPDSQDTWILGRDCLDSLELKAFQFQYGIPGCDNIISVELLRQSFLIVNPAYTIKTHHNHASSIRTYNARNDVLYNPAYMYIDPTALQPFGIKKMIGPARTISSMCSFSRTVHSIGYESAPPTLDKYTPPVSGNLYHIQEKEGLFVSPAGLLYDFQQLWIGSEELYKLKWNKSSMSILHPTISVPSLIAIHDSTNTNPVEWVLSTLPTILRIQALGNAQYVVPDHEILKEFLSPALVYQPMVQYWSKDVWAYCGTSQLPTNEDIALLRTLLKEAPSNSNPAVLFLVDEKGISESFAKHLYEMHFVHRLDCETVTKWDVQYLSSNSSFAAIRSAIQSADWIIGSADHPLFPWCWMARPGSTLLTIAYSESLAHLAGAADLKYITVPGLTAEDCFLQVGQAVQKFGMKLRLQELSTKRSLPTLIIPAGSALQGMHVHSGDSFRAMLRLWADRKYCTLLESSETPFCWWGAIGDTLLYDRDTMKWMDVAKPSYTLALIGNPSPTDKIRQSKWSYWTRYPALVEAVIPLSWKDRSIASLFLGRIENGVQQKHRSGADWKSAVEVFTCPIDSSGGPYKYSPSEYLEKLCSAKFGLCLAGFGQKCHREIEYYACGTVPIATPECDMTGYLNPPIEGIHYFRAKTPEEVKRIVAETSAIVWTRMSLAGRFWWAENASAEGLFRLTANRIKACLPYAGIAIPM